MRELLGGKGANVAEMTRVSAPSGARRVHDHDRGVRRLHARRPRRARRAGRGGRRALARLEERGRQRLGDTEDPLLVSVRSGARESMPGMMDTVLNLGLNDALGRGPRRAHRQRALRVGRLRRFVQMFGNVVPRHAGRAVEEAIRRARRRGREARHGARRGRPARAGDGFRAIYEPPARTSRRTPGATAPGDPRRVRLLAGRARRRPTGASTTSPTKGHGCQRAADGVRQQGRRRRARAWRSRATR